ncbi:hypothetical protein ElyMa_001555900 [Elysia marginata]|uniref:Uncharacterized protein n=1 Tax=Elysia marginata TaxID=1093978 RepID=A0AAV4JDW5_9GAST|nr:hypothetical protein ElyMa_001555900 [Elysia marginata]
MPKAFVISRKRKHHPNMMKNENHICSSPYAISSSTKVQSKHIGQELCSPDSNVQKNDQNESSKSSSVNEDKCGIESKSESELLSIALIPKSKEPHAIGFLRELCAGEKKWYWKYQSGLQTSDSNDKAYKEQGYSLPEVQIVSNVSGHHDRRVLSSQQSQITCNVSSNSSGLLTTAGTCVSAGIPKDPRRAILFHDSDVEKEDDSTDVNNNNNNNKGNNHSHECDVDEASENYRLKTPENHDYNYDIGHTNMFALQNSQGSLGSYSECFPLNHMGPDSGRASGISSESRSYSHPALPMTQTSVREVDLTHVEGFYHAPYFTRRDNGLQQNQSFRLGNHLGLGTRGSPPVMSAFRSPVKLVRSDPSPTPLSSSSTLFIPTTTASPLRRLSPPLQSKVDNRNASCYQQECPVLTVDNVPETTGSNSETKAVVVATAVDAGENGEKKEEEHYSTFNHKDSSSNSSTSEARIIIASTDKIHSGNTGTIASHTQEEVIAVSTSSLGRNIINANNRELIKASSPCVDQHGTDTAKSRTSTSGPRTADTDRRLPWTGPGGGHERSPVRGDCHLVTGKGRNACKVNNYVQPGTGAWR